MITGNEPAMPSSCCCDENGIYNGADTNNGTNGLTIRQQFAKNAQISFDEAWSILSKNNPNANSIVVKDVINTMAQLKVWIADALIAELNRTEANSAK